MDKKWFLYSGVAVAAAAAWYVLRNKGSSSNSGSATSGVGPTLESTGFTSGVKVDNVPWEETWPYNQLALPYNYNAQNAGVVTQNADFLNPQNPTFVGYNPTVITSG